MKICSKCKVLKEDSYFYIRRNRKGGLSSKCKLCRKQLFKNGTYKDNNIRNIISGMSIKELKHNYPHKIRLQKIKARCKCDEKYKRFSVMLTENDLKYMWIRDKAYLMKRLNLLFSFQKETDI